MDKEEREEVEEKLENKTPHEVKIVDKEGNVIKTFPRSTNPVRLESETERVGELNDVPLSKTSMSGGNLPPQRDNVYYIVSRAVQQAYPDRPGLLIPNETVRDDEGKIVGCKSLAVSPSFNSSELTEEEFLVDMTREKAMSNIDELEEVGILSQVAEDHETVITPSQLKERKLTPSSSVYELENGKNGKRKLYAILNQEECITFAYGTFFGNKSSFHLEGEEISDITDEILCYLTESEKTNFKFEFSQKTSGV